MIQCYIELTEWQFIESGTKFGDQLSLIWGHVHYKLLLCEQDQFTFFREFLKVNFVLERHVVIRFEFVYVNLIIWEMSLLIATCSCARVLTVENSIQNEYLTRFRILHKSDFYAFLLFFLFYSSSMMILLESYFAYQKKWH